jgi:porin
MIGQVGWTPEFCKRPGAASKPSDGKSVASGKTLAEGKTVRPVSKESDMQGLPGNYWFGAYYSPWQYAQFGSTETASNSYGFYWHADQMVWQEAAGSDQGLTLWSAFVLSPQQNISKLPFQVNSGIVYKGLVPMRDNDITMLGFVYGNFSDDYAETISATGAGTPSYEIALEAGYRFQITKFAYVQPNLQWIINPAGTGNIPNALVLGAQMNVTF